MNTLLALALAITGTLNIDGVDYDVRLTPKEPPPVVVAPPAPEPEPPAAEPPAPAPPPIVNAGPGFCDAPGVVACETFDDPLSVERGARYDGYVPARVVWDGGAVRFDAPAGSVANTSGSWNTSMTEAFGPGKVLTVEYQIRLSELWADASIGGHGPKVMILYQRGEKTCGWTELAQAFSRFDYLTFPDSGFPLAVYTNCGRQNAANGEFYPEPLLTQEQRLKSLLYTFWQTGDGPVEDAIANAHAVQQDAFLRQARNPEAERWCSYDLMRSLEARQSRSCLRGIQPETWTQVLMRVTRYTDERHPDTTLIKQHAADRRNTLEMWWAPVGEPLQLIRRVEWFHLLGAQSEVMITPYRTKAAGLIGDHQMWFDNLRVTLQPLD